MKSFLSLFVISFIAVAAVLPARVNAYGNSSSNNFTMPSAPVCGKEKPDAPILFQPSSSSKSGKVTLSWNPVAKATTYTLAYGLSSRNYIYGAVNIGNVTSYTVNSLTPGQKYYFSVLAVNECMPSNYSNEWGVNVKKENNAVVFENFFGFGTRSVQAAGTTSATITPSVTPTATISATPTVMPTPEVTFETDKVEVVVEEPGFFGKLWNAIKGIFGN